MYEYWGVEVELHSFLTSAPEEAEVEWSASCPGHFNPRERAPSMHWIGSRVGFKTCLGMVAKRKKSLHFPFQELNPSNPPCSLITILTELPHLILVYIIHKLLFEGMNSS
jgi:hypothetical protein